MASTIRKASALLLACSLGACAADAPTAVTGPVADATTAALSATDRKLVIDDVALRVRIEGPDDAPPIILIHGFTFSLETWDGWAADLKRDHRVIRYDLAGHGLSDADPQKRYGTQGRVEELRALMDRLGVKHAVLAGNSFGGLVAWNFAARYPDRVDRLILVDSAAFSINGVTDRPVPVPDVMKTYLLDPTPAGVAFSASQIFAHPERLSPERLDLMRVMIARHGPALIEHLERFTLPEPAPLLATIQTPTLILWGASDKVVPVAHASRLAAAMPHAQTIIYPDIGHAPQEEATAQSIADVRHFLDSTS